MAPSRPASKVRHDLWADRAARPRRPTAAARDCRWPTAAGCRPTSWRRSPANAASRPSGPGWWLPARSSAWSSLWPAWWPRPAPSGWTWPRSTTGSAPSSPWWTASIVAGGRARPSDSGDPLADHPFLAALEAGGVTPPSPEGIDRAELRELVRRGLVVERDGLYFAPSAIDAAAAGAARLLAASPDGFTVGRAARPARHHPQARAAAGERAGRARHHPPPRRPAHRRTPPLALSPPEVTCPHQDLVAFGSSSSSSGRGWRRDRPRRRRRGPEGASSALESASI